VKPGDVRICHLLPKNYESETAMNLQRIVFPTDFSGSNDAAFRYAQCLAAESGATLYIVHVDEPDEKSSTHSAMDYMYSTPLGGNDRREIRERLRDIRPERDDVVYKHRYFRGTPADEILRFARLEDVDLIIMSSHGRTGLSRFLMGSVAEVVMRKSSCPVLIVKQAVFQSVGGREREHCSV
jgi:nucleotide-binding universal stress UspA family protein